MALYARAQIKSTKDGHFYIKMKKNLKEKLINRQIKAPNKFLAKVIFRALKVVSKKNDVTFHHSFDPSILKGKPSILLAGHASRLEFIYALAGYGQENVNIVCGYQNIMAKGFYGLLIKMGVISKFLYQPDFMCIKHMMSVLKRDGALVLFPEGIQSTSGSTHPINPATCKFLKKSRANVVVCRSEGAYLATNRYSSDKKKGKIDFYYDMLFTPDDLARMSEDEIYQKLMAAFRYNEMETNKTKRVKFVGKRPNIDGLTKIIYKCPNCGKEGDLRVLGANMACQNCGYEVTMNEYYDLLPVRGRLIFDDIDKWYKWQRKEVRREVLENEGFSMAFDGRLCVFKTDKLRKFPKNMQTVSIGSVAINKRRLWFYGTIDGKRRDFSFEMRGVYSLTFSTKGFLEFYYGDEYYRIFPDKKGESLIKWTLASEEIHNLYDERWYKASSDVYDY